MIPTLYWRDGDWLYIHGKRGGHMLKHLYTGADMCVCVTHVSIHATRGSLARTAPPAP